MTRLTNASRDAICKKAIEHAFGKESAQLGAEREKLARDVYEDLYLIADRRRMQRLPKGWLPEVSSIQVQFGSSFTRLSFDKKVRIPSDDEHRCVKVYIATSELALRHADLRGREKALEAKRTEARAKVRATLNSVNTLNRLHEIWPESKHFTTGISFEIPNLPAVPVKELNKLLGIAA